MKEKKSEVQPEATPEKVKADTVVQIGEIKVVVQDKGREPVVIDKSAASSVTPARKPFTANNLEASGSKEPDKYHQPRWCPKGLTHTQKRKLQRLCNKEKREQEAEKARDEYFNKYRPMIPQGKVWQVKVTDQPTVRPVEPTPVTGQTGIPDRLDRPEPPVRLVEPSAESTAEAATLILVSHVDEVEPAPPAKEDEELVDYEASPERNNLEINVVHMSSDYLIISEEEVAHLQFGPRDAVF